MNSLLAVGPQKAMTVGALGAREAPTETIEAAPDEVLQDPRLAAVPFMKVKRFAAENLPKEKLLGATNKWQVVAVAVQNGLSLEPLLAEFGPPPNEPESPEPAAPEGGAASDDDEPPPPPPPAAALAALTVAESAEAVDEADDYVAMVRQRTSTADGPRSNRESSASDAPPPPPPPQAIASSTAAATPSGKVIDADGEEPWSPTLKGEVETAEAAKARAKAERRAMQRLKTLEEIIATERVYVERLNLTLKVYLTPLRLVADSPKGAIFSHEELDAIFLNFETIKTVDAAQFGAILARNSLTSLHPAQVNSTFLDALEAEHEANWPAVRFAPILNKAAKNFKGCYSRYLNNYDKAEAMLSSLRAESPDKQRYLDIQHGHPDARGLDLRSYLSEPVKRLPRYRLLLESLLGVTDAGHDEEDELNEALKRMLELCTHMNEEKRTADTLEKLKSVDASLDAASKESVVGENGLVRLGRALVREGELVKVRKAHQQARRVFLFTDLLLYTTPAAGGTGYVVKGAVRLDDGARAEELPATDDLRHAFVLIGSDGKGYTWIAENDVEAKQWFSDISAAIDSAAGSRAPSHSVSVLESLPTRSDAERLAAVANGSILMKYNQRDGSHALRYVCVRTAAGPGEERMSLAPGLPMKLC